MKIAGIDFPSPLLSALRDGELVIFAGAGVSMGEPACLPSFKELAEKIAQGTGEVLQEEEPEDSDSFLGRLHDKGVKVHERAVRELSRNNPKPTALHENLLRLYRKSEKVRVVTTNFDLLFEEAAQDVFGTVPKVSQAPELPQARDFYGIAHIHGDLNHSQGLVLTDKDFGAAYMNKGWAKDFLVELFGHLTVLFVGYSHNDIILNYLARGLLVDSTKPRRFALTDDSDLQRWKSLGIDPVIYPKPNAKDHRNKIAKTFWATDQDQFGEKISDWLTLAPFWLNSLSIWWKQQDPVPEQLDGEYLAALSCIMEDRTGAGRAGRSFFAGRFASLLAIDENWTKKNLLPLFYKKNHRNADDYKAIWDGFLTLGRLPPSVAELLDEAFLEAVQYINSDLSDQRDRFIEAYVTMIVYYVNDPIKKWIPKFFAHSDAKDRDIFVFKMGNLLRQMDETQQQEQWNRWLKCYWQNRLEGIPPKPLESDEIEGMLDWLPYLTGVFPEAVDLAIQMPKIQWNAGEMLYRLEKGDLPNTHPEAVARLVIHLGQSDLPSYAWYKGRELIGRLLKSPLPLELKTKLQGLDAKLIN